MTINDRCDQTRPDVTSYRASMKLQSTKVYRAYPSCLYQHFGYAVAEIDFGLTLTFSQKNMTVLPNFPWIVCHIP